MALFALPLAATPAWAGLLPSPLPTIVNSSSPLPLPTIATSPLPLPSVPTPSASLPILGRGSPSPTPTSVGAAGIRGGTTLGTTGSAGSSGGGGTRVSSAGSHPAGSGSSGGSRSHAGGGGATSPVGLGPLPAFPGLPQGAVQTVTWVLVLLVPVMLLVWIFALIRTLSRLRVLRSPATLIAAASELGLSPREIASLSPSALEKLRDQLALDELTGCMRRASGIAALEREIARARRERTSLALAFVDADGLKHANDTLGHQAGDQLLKDVVEGLKSRLRGSDFVFRYGGDEFVCVLPSATAVATADVLLDVQTQLRERGRSFSMGITELRPDDDAVSVLGRADEELYAAKRALKAGRQQAAKVRLLPTEIQSAGG